MTDRKTIEHLWTLAVGHPPESREERALFQYALAGAELMEGSELASGDLPTTLADGGIVLSPLDIEGTRYALRRIMGFGSDLDYVGQVDFEGVAQHALGEDATNAQKARFAKALRYIVVEPDPPEEPAG